MSKKGEIWSHYAIIQKAYACPGDMREDVWLYHKEKCTDRQGRRWHFVLHQTYKKKTNFDDDPFAVYFRDDEETTFGVIRFETRRAYPYRTDEMLIDKIMNKADFRESLLDERTREVWRPTWK